MNVYFKLHITSLQEDVTGDDDASAAKWFRVNNLPDMAFDHNEIVTTTIENVFST